MSYAFQLRFEPSLHLSRFVLITILLFASSSLNAQTQDKVVTKGGSTLLGKLEGVEGGRFVFKDNDLGRIKFGKQRIAEMDLQLPLDVFFQRTKRHSVKNGKLSRNAAGELVVDLEEEGDLPFNPALFSRLRFSKFSAWNMRGKLEASLTSIDGNSEELVYGGKGEYRFDHPWHSFLLRSDGNFGKAGGRRTTQRARATFEYTYKALTGIGFVVREGLDHNDFRSLRVRSVSTLGIAWYAIQEPKFKVRADFGFAYTIEDRKGAAKDEEFAGTSSKLDVDYIMTSVLSASFTSAGNLSLERFDDYNTKSEISLNFKIKELLDRTTFSAVFQNDHESRPPKNRKKNDYRFIFRLGFEFS